MDKDSNISYVLILFSQCSLCVYFVQGPEAAWLGVHGRWQGDMSDAWIGCQGYLTRSVPVRSNHYGTFINSTAI